MSTDMIPALICRTTELSEMNSECFYCVFLLIIHHII